MSDRSRSWWARRKTRARRLQREIKAERLHADRLAEALRLTQEYAQLPAQPGWSWFDALEAHRAYREALTNE